MAEMVSWLAGTTIVWLCCVAVTLPFVILAVRSKQGANKHTLVLLAGFFFVILALARSERAVRILRSPWQGMALQALFALLVIYGTKSAGDCGLTKNRATGPRDWVAGVWATVVLLVFVVLRSLALRVIRHDAVAGGTVNWEFLAYQLTMPGVAEELAYRGVIQSGLNRVFGRSWRFLGAEVGWGWVVTSVAFWAMHAFRVDSQMELSFYWPTLTMQLWVGLVLGWMRERTESVYPSMLAHNLVNVVWTLA